MASVESAGGHERVCARAPGAEQPGERQAVENCVPLISARPSLGPSVDRREAGARRAPRRRAGRAVELGLALADHHRRHVRERREVARCADRALARDDAA